MHKTEKLDKAVSDIKIEIDLINKYNKVTESLLSGYCCDLSCVNRKDLDKIKLNSDYIVDSTYGILNSSRLLLNHFDAKLKKEETEELNKNSFKTKKKEIKALKNTIDDLKDSMDILRYEVKNVYSSMLNL